MTERCVIMVRAVAALAVAAFAAGLMDHGPSGPRAGRLEAHPAPPPRNATQNPRDRHARNGLYTDDEVRRVVEWWTARDPHDEALLRVVPNGTTAPLLTVFVALGIDPARLGKPGEVRLFHVVTLTWQVSPSYDLSCMTATNDPANKGVGYTDPRRRLYGVRIGKRDR